jgi:hypothetical protein
MCIPYVLTYNPICTYMHSIGIYIQSIDTLDVFPICTYIQTMHRLDVGATYTYIQCIHLMWVQYMYSYTNNIHLMWVQYIYSYTSNACTHIQTMNSLDVGGICTNVQRKHRYLFKYATGSPVRIKFNCSEMESISSSSVASSSCEMILGQGAAGTVKVYNPSRLGPVARKMIVTNGCYQRERYFLEMCRARYSEPVYKFIINCLGCIHKSDTLFIIDFELAATDLHLAAINVNDVPTGCTRGFQMAIASIVL